MGVVGSVAVHSPQRTGPRLGSTGKQPLRGYMGECGWSLCLQNTGWTIPACPRDVLSMWKQREDGSMGVVGSVAVHSPQTGPRLGSTGKQPLRGYMGECGWTLCLQTTGWTIPACPRDVLSMWKQREDGSMGVVGSVAVHSPQTGPRLGSTGMQPLRGYMGECGWTLCLQTTGWTIPACPRDVLSMWKQREDGSMGVVGGAHLN